MKKELDEALCRDFPKLFRDRHAPMNQTCMCWGFPGDGWEPLIRRCAEKLEAINNTIEDPKNYIIASQVKEKFGSLRFYVDVVPQEHYEAVRDAINEAENTSEVTCEICSKPGTISGPGWYLCLCPECKGERAKERVKK